MAKTKRAREAHASSGMEAAFRLWGKGNVLGARRAAARVLEGEPNAAERAEAEELLQATFPDRRTRLVAFGAVLLLGLILVTLKFLGV
jgi:hypothetical protein